AVAAHSGEIVAGRDAEVEAVEWGRAIATAPCEDGVRHLRPGAQPLELQILAPLGPPLDHLSPPLSRAGRFFAPASVRIARRLAAAPPAEMGRGAIMGYRG